MMVDHTGAVVDGDELLYIIATDLQERERLTGGVVGTLMSNLGLELALKAREIPFCRAKVGDRYVIAEMLDKGGFSVARIRDTSSAPSTPLLATRSSRPCK